MALGVICSCAPALKALQAHYYGSISVVDIVISQWLALRRKLGFPPAPTPTSKGRSRLHPEKRRHQQTWQSQPGWAAATVSRAERGSVSSFNGGVLGLRGVEPQGARFGAKAFGEITVLSTIDVDLEEMEEGDMDAIKVAFW